MSNCPNCGVQIKEDFGLVDCPGCSSALFVDLDGGIQAYGENPGSVPEPGLDESIQEPEVHDATQEEDPFLPVEDISSSEDELDSVDAMHEEYASEEPLDDWNDQGALDAEDANQAYEPLSPDSEGLPDLQSAPDSSSFNEPAFSSDQADDIQAQESLSPEADKMPADEPLMAEAPVYGEREVTYESADMSEISDFANSEVSQGREGNIRYSLLISGIDTADIREALREALTDRRFIWDTESLIRSIEHGRLRIDEMTSIKAFVLVKRLRDLPILIEWEQHAINQV